MVERMKWGRQRIVQQLRWNMRTKQQQQTELAQGLLRKGQFEKWSDWFSRGASLILSDSRCIHRTKSRAPPAACRPPPAHCCPLLLPPACRP